MTSPLPRHCRAFATTDTATTDTAINGELPASPAPLLDIRCHRRLRGPYTGGGTLLRAVVPEVMKHAPDLVMARTTEIIAVAPELASPLPAPRTLTDTASSAERTRAYLPSRTLRLSHGITELLVDWAGLLHPGGVVIAFRELDDADPTDRELVGILLRRCDPALITVVAEAADGAGDILDQALARYTSLTAELPRIRNAPSPGADLAQLFIDSDGTSRDPELTRAYDTLPPDERARRHAERAQALAAADEPSLRLGAIPYHAEHGTDPAGTGVDAIIAAVEDCFARGFHEAAAELAVRGRRLVDVAEQPKQFLSLTYKLGVCLSYLERGEEAMRYFAEIRRESTDGDAHFQASYQTAMLYTRHLPKPARDQDRALEWVNNAIAIADRHPDAKRRAFFRAFSRNAKALVELHRNNLDAALALVHEAIKIADADLEPDEHRLHRSVLVYNQGQVLAAEGDYAGALEHYDEAISRDPAYGDYYCDRAAVHRAAGHYDQALADYATAIRLSPPSYEAHYNRADLLRELGDLSGALSDLDYAIELEPAHVDSLVNRVDLLLELGALDQAADDIEAGLNLDPRNARLLTALGSVLAEVGDEEGAYDSYTAALDEDPGLAAAWANRAVLLYSEGRVAESLDDLDRAIELAPDDDSLRANRAVAVRELAVGQGAA